MIIIVNPQVTSIAENVRAGPIFLKAKTVGKVPINEPNPKAARDQRTEESPISIPKCCFRTASVFKLGNPVWS